MGFPPHSTSFFSLLQKQVFEFPCSSDLDSSWLSSIQIPGHQDRDSLRSALGFCPWWAVCVNHISAVSCREGAGDAGSQILISISARTYHQIPSLVIWLICTIHIVENKSIFRFYRCDLFHQPHFHCQISDYTQPSLPNPSKTYLQWILEDRFISPFVPLHHIFLKQIHRKITFSL